MPLPWLQVVDAVLTVTDLALTRIGGRKRPDGDAASLLAENGSSARAAGNLETHLAGVVVAALKEAFDRDSRRLDLEREQAEAERQRAERALRLELARQAVDREIGRLRLTAGVAVAAWLGTLLFSARLVEGGIAARLLVGGGWALLLAALAASFMGQSALMRAVARGVSDGEPAVSSGRAGALAGWFIVVGLALIGASVLVA